MEKQDGPYAPKNERPSAKEKERGNDLKNKGKVDLQGGAPTDTPGEKTGAGDKTDTPEMEELNDE